MNEPQSAAPSTQEDLAALFNYPSLGRLFDSQTGASELAAMRERFAATIQNLERVQRQGSQTDATRAARIVEAYRTTLKFLDELEQLGKNQANR